mgnify:CR=1 FL=1
MLSIEFQFKETDRSYYAKNNGNQWQMTRGELYQVPREDREIAEDLVELLRSDYERATIYSEDNIIVLPARNQIVSFDVISGECFDSRNLVKSEYTETEIHAVLALAIDDQHPDAEKLYPIAEEVVKDWPKECRPMP